MDVTTMPPAHELNDRRLRGLTRLQRALAACKNGEKPNACPFGCPDDQLDEHGYCRHLIGFTNNTDDEIKAGKGLYEPMGSRRGRRVIQIPREKIVHEGTETEDGEPDWEWGPPKLQPMRKSDQWERCSISARVYRDVDKETKAPKLDSK
jgi:hypothetical protein